MALKVQQMVVASLEVMSRVVQLEAKADMERTQ